MNDSDKRQLWEEYITESRQIIKKQIEYIPSDLTISNITRDIKDIRHILSDITPYADRIRKNACYTNDDVYKVHKVFHIIKKKYTNQNISVCDITKALYQQRELYNIELKLGSESKNDCDYICKWEHGNTKTYYIIENMIKDNIIKTHNSIKVAIHGGKFKTRDILDIILLKDYKPKEELIIPEPSDESDEQIKKWAKEKEEESKKLDEELKRINPDWDKYEEPKSEQNTQEEQSEQKEKKINIESPQEVNEEDVLSDELRDDEVI